jgi:hypothetical protein
MHPSITTTAFLAAASGRHFELGPWIIVPILIVAAIVGTIVFVLRDRQRRRSSQDGAAALRRR